MGRRREVECPVCNKRWTRSDGLVSTGVYNICRKCNQEKLGK